MAVQAAIYACEQPCRVVSERLPLPAQSLGASRLLLALHFVCKWLSSFALEVQEQVSGHGKRGGNPQSSRRAALARGLLICPNG